MQPDIVILAIVGIDFRRSYENLFNLTVLFLRTTLLQTYERCTEHEYLLQTVRFSSVIF